MTTDHADYSPAVLSLISGMSRVKTPHRVLWPMSGTWRSRCCAINWRYCVGRSLARAIPVGSDSVRVVGPTSAV